MTEREWVSRCAAYIVLHTLLSVEKALNLARECYINDDPREGSTPEQAAINAISSWSTD